MGSKGKVKSVRDPSSSSSSSDEEELAKFKDAVDPAFSLSLAKNGGKRGHEQGEVPFSNGLSDSSSSPASVTINNIQRNGDTRKSIRQSLLRQEEEFPKPYSLEVTPETQSFIAKKLSKSLDKILDEVQVDIDASKISAEKKLSDKKRGVFLFSSSERPTSSRDLRPKKVKKQKKPELKRKRHVDGSDSEDEDEKLRAVAVSAEWVKKCSF